MHAPDVRAHVLPGDLSDGQTLDAFIHAQKREEMILRSCAKIRGGVLRTFERIPRNSILPPACHHAAKDAARPRRPAVRGYDEGLSNFYGPSLRYPRTIVISA